MPAAHAQLKKGQVFGPATVVGPAEPEFRMVGGRRRRYVRIECWSCKDRRDVQVTELIARRVGLCIGCHRMRHGRSIRVLDETASLTRFLFGSSPSSISSLRELER